MQHTASNLANMVYNSNNNLLLIAPLLGLQHLLLLRLRLVTKPRQVHGPEKHHIPLAMVINLKWQ